MLSCLISLFLSCYCSGCHSLLYVSQVSWPSSCLIPLTSCQLWCPGCMLAGFTWDTSKGTHWLDLRVIPVMTSPSPVYSQLPWGTLNLFFFFLFYMSKHSLLISLLNSFTAFVFPADQLQTLWPTCLIGCCVQGLGLRKWLSQFQILPRLQEEGIKSSLLVRI